MSQTNAIFTSPLARIQARMNAAQTPKATQTTKPTTTSRTTSNDNSDAAVLARLMAEMAK